jgi:hypothetical protein
MKLLLIPFALFLGTAAASATEYVVTQGVGGKVLGYCNDHASCAAIRKSNPGFGEYIVNVETGRVRNWPGRHHKDRDKGPKTH